MRRNLIEGRRSALARLSQAERFHFAVYDEDNHVEGLTTAASLLAVSGVGVCVAVGRVWLAAGVVGLLLAVLFSGRWLAAWRGRKKQGKAPAA